MGFSQASGTISRSNIDITRTTYYLNAGMLKIRGKMIAIMGGDNFGWLPIGFWRRIRQYAKD